MQTIRDDEKDENDKKAQSEKKIKDTDIETVAIDKMAFKLPDSVQKLQTLASIVNGFA